ncbi:protein of unknown function [Methylocaldum szegediense]|uniref:Uncharacterized protein n=1 Tax=Methylocaldum szegediense TaxID=73780 RepID=A0ABM9HY31_9GAMM|nr:protein of unknown function [Methylocaldum szegediense]
MLNRTVHHSPSSVQVPIPYVLAQNLKAQGHNLHALVVEFLQGVAEGAAKKTDFTQREQLGTVAANFCHPGANERSTRS